MTALPDQPDSSHASSGETQRLDKWLWFARLAKTRTLATALVDGGKIRVNKVKVSKPSQNIRSGDVITATVARRVRIFRVCATGVRRGPATEARTLYEELTPASVPIMSQEQKSARAGRSASAPMSQPAALRDVGSGRPTKRDRRQIDRLQKSIDE